MKISLFLFLIIICDVSFAQEGIFQIFNPNPTPFSLYLGQENFPSSKAHFFSDELEYSRTTLKTTIPLAHDETSKHFMFLEGDMWNFDFENPVPANPVPKKLYQSKVGYTWTRRSEDGTLWGLTPQLNSNSDKLYATLNVTEISLTAFKFWTTSAQASWMLSLNYSSNRDFLVNHIPIPGFEYIYRGEQGTYFLGFPINGILWNITPEFKMSYFLIFYIQNLKFTYDVTSDLQLYTEFSYRPTKFRLKAESDDDKKIYIENKRLVVGAKYPLSKNLTLDLYGGRIFDFRMYQTEDFGDEKDWLEEADDQNFFNVQLGLRI